VLTRFAVGLLWLLHFLPFTLLAVIGAGLGRLGFYLIRERRHVCLTNLAKCFPDMPERERVALAKRHFAAVARAFLDHGVLFWSSQRRIARLVRVVHWERYLEVSSEPVIFLAPHFVGLDAGGTRLTIDTEAVSMYSNQKDPFINDLLRRHRSRFRPVRLFSRQDGIRPVIREMRKGLPFYYLPDQDYGPRDSLFVPFFGVPAATITGLSRVAQLSRARVVPTVTRMLPRGQGYEVRVYPPWKDFPSGDDAADARRMNAFIEERILEMPEQYNWVHKRFKTRPPGEARFY
jgi:Kdo2-lipid IVA lauroyltransferase/acyltransferase